MDKERNAEVERRRSKREERMMKIRE